VIGLLTLAAVVAALAGAGSAFFTSAFWAGFA